jgi:signal transduction histidine kinase
LHERIEQDARFAADVSHELRTPVTTLTTSLSLLQRSPDLTPRSAHAVQLMAQELTRFRLALEDLLTLGRLDAGGHEAEPTRTGARELVGHALQAVDKPPDLILAEPEDGRDPTLQVDRVQMLRVFTNLFWNAELHGGGLTGVTVIDRFAVVDVRVEDRGSGVPEVDRTRIFERFARAGGQKVGTGSGLGLSIVAQTVRNHGGDVWCADRAGGGAVFVVRLPTAGTEEP